MEAMKGRLAVAFDSAADVRLSELLGLPPLDRLGRPGRFGRLLIEELEMPVAYAVLRSPSDPASGMGANLLPDGRGASFRVWAPNATDVQILLRPTDGLPYQSFGLLPDPSNHQYFSVDIGGVAEGHQYRFQITNSGVGENNSGGVFERIDPYTRDIESTDAAAPGYVVRPSFPSVPFQTPRWENFIIYQLHLGSAAGLNDGLANQIVNRVATFRQIADNKLDRIRALGFNAIQFLPASQ